MIKVSVIIPVYNVEKYLKECLDSVINQTLCDIEIIIINNGTNLNDKKIIDFYNDNPKIKTIVFDENQGYGKAINIGIKEANGEYISLVDSDDYIDFTMLENLYYLAKNNDADIVKSNFTCIKDDGYKYLGIANKDIPTNRLLSLEERALFLSEHPSIWSCLYRKDFLLKNNISFIERKYSSWVDNAFQVETLVRADKFIYTNKPYNFYRVLRPGSSSCIQKALFIPCEAIKDVYNVIKIFNIKNSEVLKHLSKRHAGYITSIINQAPFKELKSVSQMANEAFELIDTNPPQDKKYKKIKNKYYKKGLFFTYLKNKIKKFRKFIISAKFSKKKSYIKIFNMYLYKGVG